MIFGVRPSVIKCVMIGNPEVCINCVWEEVNEWSDAHASSAPETAVWAISARLSCRFPPSNPRFMKRPSPLLPVQKTPLSAIRRCRGSTSASGSHAPRWLWVSNLWF